MARYYQKADDEIILQEIKSIISTSKNYGYRRVTLMVNCLRMANGKLKINHKRVQRIMQMTGLSVPKKTPEQKQPTTDVIMTLLSPKHLG